MRSRLAAATALGAALWLGGCDRQGVGVEAAGVSAQARAQPNTGPEAVRRARLLESFAELQLSDSAYRFRAIVERNSGGIDTVSVPVLSVEDTTVASLADGAVLPREVGQTSVRLEIAPGMRVRAVVQVTERIFADSVWLSPGQVRAWELQPSWYRITVDAKAPPGEPQPLELAADLICVPDSRGPKETIACRVRQNTRVLLRHTGAGRTPGPAVAVVTILRTPR